MKTAAARQGERESSGAKEPFSYLSILGRAKAALDSGREITVNVSQIRPYPNQPRKYFNPDGIRRLSESIDASGQTTSGIIRNHPSKKGYELIDGERRWRAVSLIPEARRPLYKAKLIVADDDVVQYLISGIANFNREGHTVLETMETIDRLLGFEFPMKDIAGLLGISEVWAGQIHGLKKLVPDVLGMLDEALSEKKRLPVTAAIQISKIEGKFQLGLAQRVLSREIPLTSLRTEVVAVAKSAGAYIRERKKEPSDIWVSTKKNLDIVRRKVEVMKVSLEPKEMGPYLDARPTERKEALRQIRQIAADLERLRKKVDKDE